MRVAVYGLWHLGCVTAACVAERFPTVACDPDPRVISGLLAGRPPVFEAGLAELIAAGVGSGRLEFTTDLQHAVGSADVVWVTFDTPVNEDDVAEVESIRRRVEALFPYVRDGAIVLVSSQVPAGFTGEMERSFGLASAGRKVRFAYSPENLRLGKALEAFRHAERIVAGVRAEEDQARLAPLFTPFCRQIEWMGLESAEMTKHAINAFLATSVCFINELASLCEQVGADAKELERGLKSEPRIGPKAYLSPGSAFSGGTLARDIVFLKDLGRRVGVSTHLFGAVESSNNEHKLWPRRKLSELLAPLRGKTIAILGLTYKPGTDTLRRSAAVELCRWVAEQGARVQAYDPAIDRLPPGVNPPIGLCASMAEACQDADAVVIATEWPAFKQLGAEELIGRMRAPVVVDANRFLDATLARDARIRYTAVGTRRVE